MANYAGLTDIIQKVADLSVLYMKRKSVFLNIVKKQTKLITTLTGGRSFLVSEPIAYIEPQTWNPETGTCEDTATYTPDRTPRTITISNFIRHRVNWTIFEQRMIEGGFKAAFDEEFGPLINGFTRSIEEDIATLYTEATHEVGTGGTPLTDETFREAMKTLSDVDVYPELGDVYAVFGTDAYWKDLLGDTDWKQAQNSGNMASLVKGVIEEKYKVNVAYTPSIVNSAGSSGATTHNMIFHKDAIEIAFMDWPTVASQVGPDGRNVEEARAGQSDNMLIRVYHYFDPQCSQVVLQMDAAYEAYVRAPDWMVDTLS